MKQFGFPILLVLIVGGLFGLFVIGNQQADKDAAKKKALPLLGEKHEDQGRTHLKAGQTNDKFNSDPPSSGDHAQAPAPWGVKDSELPAETFVHNLEHGGVLIAYSPDLPADQVAQLKALFAKLPKSKQFGTTKALLMPRSKNTKPIQLAAWTYTLSLDTVDEAKINTFYTDHIDKGPELVP